MKYKNVGHWSDKDYRCRSHLGCCFVRSLRIKERYGNSALYFPVVYNDPAETPGVAENLSVLLIKNHPNMGGNVLLICSFGTLLHVVQCVLLRPVEKKYSMLIL